MIINSAQNGTHLTARLLELIILVSSFFIPNLVITILPGSADLINSDLKLAVFIISGALQFGFMRYVISSGGIHSLRETGFIGFELRELIKVAFAVLGIVTLYFMYAAALALLPEEVQEYAAEGYRWSLESPYRAPLVFVLCIVTGYREELLFRSYSLSMLTDLKSPLPLSVAISTIVFGLLHSYEGIAAMIFAGLAGLYFCLVFIKTKSLHVIALCHGIFNALIIGLEFFG